MPIEKGGRREPNELRALYSTRPTVRDVIVEGDEDYGLVRWFLEAASIVGPVVYPIDHRAFITRHEVEDKGFYRGPRGRVETLATLYGEWGLPTPSLTCVIDADRDFLVQEPPTEECLLRTDFGSIECYTLEERVLAKWLRLTVGSDEDAAALIERVVPVLTSLFYLRVALHESGLGYGLTPKFPSCCVFGAEPHVDVEEALRLTMKEPDAADDRAAIAKRHAELLAAGSPADAREHIRGHDIAPVLRKTLGLKNALGADLWVERTLRTSLEFENLCEYVLFSDLLNRLS